eukprot:gnl/MRDRNA2_/MRDRNA2_26526_c0_seq1.p1 gnl/MRDRNA2_/MRDRNA2_26526_c0~~gnl/MRDRNA2_/MRDRNA2_26526_c0_seq1.p1  ORF type:complete len:148 (-),score=22.98 gnl/MRDRNA2_/MRDRNA2_26526_c0_seq1:9-452(-)
MYERIAGFLQNPWDFRHDAGSPYGHLLLHYPSVKKIFFGENQVLPIPENCTAQAREEEERFAKVHAAKNTAMLIEKKLQGSIPSWQLEAPKRMSFSKQAMRGWKAAWTLWCEDLFPGLHVKLIQTYGRFDSNLKDKQFSRQLGPNGT